MSVSQAELDAIAKIMKSAPPGSAKYKKAMKDLDAILNAPEELDSSGDESYDELSEAD